MGWGPLEGGPRGRAQPAGRWMLGSGARLMGARGWPPQFAFWNLDGSTNLAHRGSIPEESLHSNSWITMQSCCRTIHESFSVQFPVVLFLGHRVVFLSLVIPFLEQDNKQVRYHVIKSQDR